MSLTTFKTGKILPTSKAIDAVKNTEAPKSAVLEMISSHPDTTKRTLISSLSKELFDLARKQDLVIVVSPKPESAKA